MTVTWNPIQEGNNFRLISQMMPLPAMDGILLADIWVMFVANVGKHTYYIMIYHVQWMIHVYNSHSICLYVRISDQTYKWIICARFGNADTYCTTMILKYFEYGRVACLKISYPQIHGFTVFHRSILWSMGYPIHSLVKPVTSLEFNPVSQDIQFYSHHFPITFLLFTSLLYV